MTATVFLEGLPGAGKTSIMVTLAEALGERCLAIPETNPSPAQQNLFEGWSSDAVTSWYLYRERRRDQYAAGIRPGGRPVLAVFDRSYLSVLAYCYATAAITGQTSRYDHAVTAFDREIRPHLSPDNTIVVITTAVATSLDRRRDKQDRAFEHEWYRTDFLHALDRFYRLEAPILRVGALRVLDTTATAADQIHLALLGVVDDGTLAARLPLEQLASPLVSRRRGHHLRLPGLRNYYETHGGVRTFGQPVGDPIKHYAGTSQFFERHAVLLDDAGTMTLFDQVGASADRGPS